MATRLLLNLCDATNRCIFSNVQLHRTKFQVQSILKQNRNFQRIRNTVKNVKPPVLNVQIQNSGRKLLKGFLFATTFSGLTFVSAAVLEYERKREQTLKGLNWLPYPRKLQTTVTRWEEQAMTWWDGLPVGQQVFWWICCANVMVYLSWRVQPWRPIMMKYFMTNPANSTTCLPMLLSTFSHYNLWHLAANMYVLHSFSEAVVTYFGPEHFLAFYLSSGVFASFFSNAYKIMLKLPGASLGASGAIMGSLAYICTEVPDLKVTFIFLPQFVFTAGVLIKSVIAFDAVGCIMAWKFLDHAGHLGGAFCGIFWQSWGMENLWRKRRSIIMAWHEYRNPPKSH